MTRWLAGIGIGIGLLGLSACSSTDTKAAAGTGKGNDAGGGSHKDAAPAGFKLSWALGALSSPKGDAAVPPDAGARTLPPVAGAKVCVRGHDEIPCATSGADGKFVLDGLPPLTDLVLTIEKDGFLKEVKVIETASTDMAPAGTIFMFPTDGALGPDGVTQDTTKGAVDFFAIGPDPASSDANAFVTEPGVSVSISPAKGDGPYFSDGTGKFDKTATKTLNGLGFIYNLPAGDYTLTYDHPTLDCAPIAFGLGGWGIPVPPKSVKFTVLAGYLTDEIGEFCLPKSVIVGGDSGSSMDAGKSTDAGKDAH